MTHCLYTARNIKTLNT